MNNTNELFKIINTFEKLREKDYKAFILISSIVRELNKKNRAI